MCLNKTLGVRSVRGISGATVEHNKFCVSVHFRNVDASQYDAVLGAVEATLQQHQELHATRGRKVFEIRPQVSLRQPPAVRSPALGEPLPAPEPQSHCNLLSAQLMTDQ